MKFLTQTILALALAGSWAAGLVHAEQTGPAREVLAADYSTKRLGIVTPSGNLRWEVPIQDIHDVWVLPNGNLLFQTNWTTIVEMTPEKKIVWQYKANTMNGNEGKAVEVHGFQRLDNGLTMIAESGPSRIIEVNKEGKIVHEVKLKVKQPDPHRDTRQVRKTAKGTYLVAHESEGLVREYNAKSEIVWEYDVKEKVYSAVRLANGNTLIGAGGGSRVIEVDPSGKTVWSIEKNEIPGITLAWVTMVERLANGNTRVVNCHAGPNNPQIFEVTADKKVVWTFKDFKNFGNSTPVARVLTP